MASGSMRPWVVFRWLFELGIVNYFMADKRLVPFWATFRIWVSMGLRGDGLPI